MTQIQHPRYLIFFVIIAAAVLSGCAGGQPMESWPGITVAPQDGPHAGSAFVSFTGHIYQVNLTNGALVARIPAEPERNLNFYAPAAVADDGNLLVGGYNHTFYNINSATSQPVWTFTESKDRYVAAAFVQDDLVYAPSADGRLFALRRQDGSAAWTFLAGHSLWSTPVSDGERLYQASMDHFVYALDPSTGKELWKSDDMAGPIVAAPALSEDGVLYVAVFGSKTEDAARTSQLAALDTETGRTLWKQPLAAWVWGRPLLVDGILYFGDTAGYFYAIEAETGRTVWKYPQSGAPAEKTSILGSPAVLGDKVYFGSEAGVITILNRADGTTPLQITVGGQIYSDLVTVDDMILFAPLNYKEAIFAALNADGTIRWKFLPAKE